MTMLQKTLAVLVVCMLGCLLAGCSKPPYTTTFVNGVVTQNGQPLAGIEVQFCPDPEALTKGPSALGETDEQGKFTLRFAVPGAAESQEGAVVGMHKVTLADLNQKPAPQGSPPNPSRIPKIYGSVQTTPLKLEVKDGVGEMVIDVK